MVCKACEAKLNKVAASDPYRNRSLQNTVVASGSRARATPGGPVRGPGSNAAPSTSIVSSASGAREIGKNKLLGAKNRYSPMGAHCTICKANVQQDRAKYCQTCAFKKGLCAMCGKPILDANVKKMSKMSS